MSPLEPSQPPASTDLRERRDIWGADGCQINGRGEPYKHYRKMRIEARSGMPVVRFGENDSGPLLPAFDQHGEVFLDEVVALAFHGLPRVETLKFWPSSGYAVDTTEHVANGVLVHHRDGDVWNCARDNVAWTADAEYFDADDAKLLRPTGLYVRRVWPGLFPFSEHREPRFSGSDSLPGWMPTESKRAAA